MPALETPSNREDLETHEAHSTAGLSQPRAKVVLVEGKLEEPTLTHRAHPGAARIAVLSWGALILSSLQ